MSIIDRILGRMPSTGTQISVGKPASQAPAAATTAPAAQTQTTAQVHSQAHSQPPASSPAQSPSAGTSEDFIRVYDQFGRTLQVGRETWRRDVLLPNLQANRDNPAALFSLIADALQNGFADEVLEPARHLAARDPQPPRGAALLGAVLLQLKDFAGARDILEGALARHGHNAYLLGSLARAYAALDQPERALKLIWLALSLDPNDEGALSWLIALVNARGGQQAMLAAYARAAALPGSWRAPLWLARHALQNGDLEAALRFYEEALGRAHPAPADLLMQLSGDLGNHGQAQLLVKLTQPRFDVILHGLLVGNNLLRAYIELGLLPEARKLLEQLYAQQRPDWREHLEYWERKLDDAGKRFGEVTAPLEVMLMKLEHPVWAHGVLGFESLLPAKADSAPRVHFVCGSGEAAAHTTGKVIAQPTDQLGRLTRALPLFLAEELYLQTGVRTALLLPWVKQGGFVLSARPWTRELLPREDPPNLTVFLHVDARISPWKLRLRIEDSAGSTPVADFDHPLDLATLARDATALLQQVRSRIVSQLAVAAEPTDMAQNLARNLADSLDTPPPALLPGYLAAIEQALAVAMAARQQGSADFLHQERAIFDHLFDVALHQPALLRPRLLLVNALENQARRRPDIAAEYLGKLALLQEKHPLPPGQGRELVARAVQIIAEKSRA